MENKKKLSFWKIIGASKETILEIEDILDIGKTKSQRRSTEQTFRRFKSRELSPKKFHEIAFSKDKLFSVFCKKIIYENSTQKNEYIVILLKLYDTFKIIYEYNFHPLLSINYVSFELANLIVKMKLNNVDSLLFDNSLSKINFKKIIEKMELSKKEFSIKKELAFINDRLKTKYNKMDIKIGNIDEDSFGILLSNWKKDKLPNLTHIIHIIELLSNKSNKEELFFQLLALRIIFYIKQFFNLEEDLFQKFEARYYYFVGAIFSVSDNNILKQKLFEKYQFLNIHPEYKKNKFNLQLLNIASKGKINKLLIEKRYTEIFKEIKYIKSTNIFDDINAKIGISLIYFITSLKLKNKNLIRISFKDLSLFMMLEYRKIAYEPNKFIQLLEDKNDLDTCINILNMEW